MKKENFYEKSEALLCSMALRCDHGFGCSSKYEQEKIIQEMNKLYDLYVNGFSDKEISEKTGEYIVTVSQIREEVNGNGFFKPDENSKIFYNSLKNK